AARPRAQVPLDSLATAWFDSPALRAFLEIFCLFFGRVAGLSPRPGRAPFHRRPLARDHVPTTRMEKATMRSGSRGLRPASRPQARPPLLERLEDRLVPVTGTTFTQTNLVSDVPGMAQTTDPNLVNPWGIAVGTNSGLWVAENGSGKAETFDG